MKPKFSVTVELSTGIDRFRNSYVNRKPGPQRGLALACMTVWVIGLDRHLDGDMTRDFAQQIRAERRIKEMTNV